MPNTAPSEPSLAVPCPPAGDLLKNLTFKLYKIIGLGISMNVIGKQLPASDLDHEQICPEVVIPALAAELTDYANSCFETLESLEWLLKNDKKTEEAIHDSTAYDLAVAAGKKGVADAGAPE